MDINEVHPAMLEPHDNGSGEDFLNKGRLARLRYLVARYEKVINGRVKYSNIEGGELRSMKIVRLPLGPKVVQQKQSRKRKRSSPSSEESICGWSMEKGPREYSDEDEDDDDDEEQCIKTQPMDEDAMDESPATPGTTNKRQRIQGQSQSSEQIAKAILDLKLKGPLEPSSDQLADQKTGSQASPSLDPMNLIGLANTLKTTLLDHIDIWAEHASGFELDLDGPAGKLYLAKEVGKIMTASRSILQHVNNHCEQLARMRRTAQQYLDDAVAKGMHVDVIRMHESLIVEYKEKEKELNVEIEETRKRIDELQTLYTGRLSCSL